MLCILRSVETRRIRSRRLKGLVAVASSKLSRISTETYRAVYTVRFSGLIYVLHAFQKKSKKGIATPKQTIDLIKSRLRDAEVDYRARHKQGERKP
jgi:phage-related protein